MPTERNFGGLAHSTAGVTRLTPSAAPSCNMPDFAFLDLALGSRCDRRTKLGPLSWRGGAASFIRLPRLMAARRV
jgi:hypothetical protein